MDKKSKRRLAKVLCYLGVTLIGIGFFYLLGVAGESDYESEIGQILHPSSWYWIHGLIGVTIMAIGSFLDTYKRECYWFTVHMVQILKDRKSAKRGGIVNG